MSKTDKESAGWQGFIEQLQQERAALGESPFEFKSIPQGAATSIWAGVVASGDEVGGRYCEDCRVGEVLASDAKVSSTSSGFSAYALDPGTARALWKTSEEMVGETFA